MGSCGERNLRGPCRKAKPSGFCVSKDGSCTSSRPKWLCQRGNKSSQVQEENMEIGFVGMALIVGLLLIWFWNSIYIIKEWERGVVLRLGRLIPEAKSAGINLVFWPIETLYRINMRIETLEDRKSTRL